MNEDSKTYQCLARLKAQGFMPHAILDVGAYDGDWSRGIRKLYPDAGILMLEAMAEKGPVLGMACREISNASYLISLIGETDASDVPFFVANAATDHGLVQTGSSKFREESSVMIEERALVQRSIATILREDPRAFQLLKLDIQGGEMEALRGFGTRLDQAEVIMLETGLLPYNAGAPLIAEVLARAGELGFVLSDIGDEHRHYLDQSMVQVDCILIRESSPLRRRPPYF